MVREGTSNLLGKVTVLVVICCLVMGSFVVNTAVALDGSGTQQDPWRIESLLNFNEFAADENYWDDYTRLETDVNLAGLTYTTCVIASPLTAAFTGIFDGNDHKITNLTINGGANDFLGLFGHISDGEVWNLGIEDGSISGDEIVGVLVGLNGGSVSDCYSIGDVNSRNLAGGLAGVNNGSVSNCYSIGDVSGELSVGGLLGFNGGSVSNCYSTADVSNRILFGRNVGGLVGVNDGLVSNCYSTGFVSGYYDVGGLLGDNTEDSNVSNCYSIGSVSGEVRVGGLVGFNELGSLSNCFWDTDTQTHGVTESIGQNDGTATNVEGLPTAQMQTISTFTDVDWDFTSTWNIGENQTYPYLRTFLAGDINKDGIVNFKDFAFVALQWMEEYNLGNQPPEVLITYPEDGDRLMVGGVPPQTLIIVEADDYDGTVVRVEFFDDELKLGEDSDGSNGWSYLWQGYSLGWHVLTATAWDEEGLWGTSPPVNVEVWMPFPPPP